MGIKDKATYGEYYWSMQVEASKFLADDAEKTFAPYLAGLLRDIPRIPEMPTGFQSMLDVLAEPPDFAFLPYLIGVGVNAVDEVLDVAFDPIITMLKRAQKRATKETWLTSAEVNTLWSRKKISEGLWDESTASEGYEAVLANSLYESQLPYPSIPELVLYSRYNGDPDNPWTEFQKWFNISPREWPVWRWLGLQRLTTEQTQTLYKRGLLTESGFYNELARIGWDKDDRISMKEFTYLIPNAMLLTQGNLVQGINKERILTDISIADIHPNYAQTYLDAILTKPASIDLVNYMLRIDPKLTRLPTELQKIGIHPDYTDVYKTLAYPIPPVADIISMAVREAFTPAIAERFGQYEDFPPDFEKYAAMKGLTTEWARRYWAAHWSLPSPMQGFEMLHRGIIDKSDLFMLMKALDIMPFWRDKLMQMSYRRLTRVDVRRMYKIGVLSKAEVYEAYLKHGYETIDAKRMTEFTVQWALPAHASITRSDILTAYKNRMISRTEASDLLTDMGEELFHRDFMLDAVDYKKDLEVTENRIKGIGTLYKRRVYDTDKATDELSKLDLPAEEIELVMQQWTYDIKAEPPRRWTTAQTLSFIKAGLITKERGIIELHGIGYDTEHIDVYIRSIE